MKLHLGCGEKYLEGYTNIDYPPAEHSVQITSVADTYADLLECSYAAASIQEVRLHHVFEHFSRATACALLASWHSWLQLGGVIRIEVPDFQATASVMLKHFASPKRRAVAERHIFGSHEATWAVHYAGYTPKSLTALVNTFGFKVSDIKKNSWHGTHNIEIVAKKKKNIDRESFRVLAERHLRNSLVDTSMSELRLLQIWLREFDQRVEACWAR